MPRRKKLKEYALYKGDEFIDIGNAEYLANKYDITLKSFYWYAYCNKFKEKEHKRGFVVVPLDDEEDKND